jgi:hypothetical protein
LNNINNVNVLAINYIIMAVPNLILIQALRDTATKIASGNHYAWGHHGSCNCGNLLQVVTQLSKEEILTYAHTGNGEYCGVTNAPVDLLIKKLQELGLTTSDIHNIEYLEDRQVLHKLEGGFRWLQRNNRVDVVDYFNAFANLLEEQLIASIPLNMETLLKEIETIETVV